MALKLIGFTLTKSLLPNLTATQVFLLMWLILRTVCVCVYTLYLTDNLMYFQFNPQTKPDYEGVTASSVF